LSMPTSSVYAGGREASLDSRVKFRCRGGMFQGWEERVRWERTSGVFRAGRNWGETYWGSEIRNERLAEGTSKTECRVQLWGERLIKGTTTGSGPSTPYSVVFEGGGRGRGRNSRRHHQGRVLLVKNHRGYSRSNRFTGEGGPLFGTGNSISSTTTRKSCRPISRYGKGKNSRKRAR